MGAKKGRMKERGCRGRRSRGIGRESIALVREIPCLSSKSSYAWPGARLQLRVEVVAVMTAGTGGGSGVRSDALLALLVLVWFVRRVARESLRLIVRKKLRLELLCRFTERGRSYHFQRVVLDSIQVGGHPNALQSENNK